ncbi:MAG TPA: hypothetical protein VFE92_00175 [Dermatophilaceae bacterium]|nr:hypothetical protein [Dermatophilaceae bacterium]
MDDYRGSAVPVAPDRDCEAGGRDEHRECGIDTGTNAAGVERARADRGRGDGEDRECHCEHVHLGVTLAAGVVSSGPPPARITGAATQRLRTLNALRSGVSKAVTAGP